MNTINGRTLDEITYNCMMYRLKRPNEWDEHCAGSLTLKGRVETAKWAYNYIQQLEAAQPKWVSVNDMLPEKDGKYIVCTAKGSVYCTKFKAYGKSGSFQTDINMHITHWISLPSMPEPPKEDCNEQ